MGGGTILVVDDEKLLRWSTCERLNEAGYTTFEAGTGSQAIQQLRAQAINLVLLDQALPDGQGTQFIAALKEARPDTPIIMMTADVRVETAVAAMKAGAYHYLNKPVNFEELLLLVEKALETIRLQREIRSLKARASVYTIESIIGNSPTIQSAKALLEKIARSPGSTVLVIGESGTGKDLAAKVIHSTSNRSKSPFMNITCSALPEQLLESELFGHERGAFTDAKQQKRGLLEEADGGTVFLDEIGEMSPPLQAKLLRFLEEKTFRRVGGSSDIRVDVRVIAATNRNLADEVRNGRFREDLFYRLNVLTVALPPLRERQGDIPLLAQCYADKFCQEFRKRSCRLSPEAIQLLESYSWPGNVRELRNVIERATLLLEGETFDPGNLQIFQQGGVEPLRQNFLLPPGGINFEQLERDLVQQALHRANGNQTKAAKLLGMNRDQIRYRIEKFGLDQSDTKPSSEAP